jgi:radical SAM superfamily enzyme YgiQ (UPF0313 family)
MAEILIATLNAKYIHSAFGLRYLLANLGPLGDRAALAEFDINQRPVDIAEAILSHEPRILGLGVYIWNVTQTTELVSILKRVCPNLTIVLGGPEVSYEWEDQPVVRMADYLITGEADLAFRDLCAELLAGRSARTGRHSATNAPHPFVIHATPPAFSELALPYDLYSDRDIAHRVLYVEASRGCPFSCEFCLSSLDIPVRQAPLDDFLQQMARLLDRGARQLKFVDRTFNLNVRYGREILRFLLERYRPGLFFHFELVPDRLPESFRELITRFPAGALQFEVGIQTFNETAAELIQRRQDYGRLEDNFRFLKSRTGVHLHSDLIVGLPGEGLESFGAGFDRLVGLGPEEIQVGILKRLRGTPITRHDTTWEMVYSSNAPYEILSNKLLDFSTVQRLKRFARFWDLVGNSGNFVQTTPLIWSVGEKSPFCGFLRFSDWLYGKVGRTDGIALVRLMELVFEFLVEEIGLPREHAARALFSDYTHGGRRDKPAFLKDFLPTTRFVGPETVDGGIPKRQARHLGSKAAGKA